jgi:hypothetical protein
MESSIPKLINTELPLKYSYLLNTVMDELDIHLKRLHKFRVDFFNKHGERTSEGKVSILRSKIKEFDDGMEEILQEEIDIKPVELPLSMLLETDIKLTVLEIESLKNAGFLLDDINSNED